MMLVTLPDMKTIPVKNVCMHVYMHFVDIPNLHANMQFTKKHTDPDYRYMHTWYMHARLAMQLYWICPKNCKSLLVFAGWQAFFRRQTSCRNTVASTGSMGKRWEKSMQQASMKMNNLIARVKQCITFCC